MPSSPAEYAEQDRPETPETMKPGSSVYVAKPGYTCADVQTLFVSGLSGQDGDAVNSPEAARNSLSDKERTALFDGLHATSAMKENCKDAPDMSVIEAALMKNPAMMFNLRRLQNAGARLVVTDFKEDRYIDFADAAQNLDIRKQGSVLVGLTKQEINDAIETIVATIADDAQKAPARDWLLSQLRRSDDAKGLNFAEALVYAAAHGGTLISHAAYDALARKDCSVYEGKTLTWYFESLSEVMASRFAPYGRRGRGVARRYRTDADYRGGGRGGRVAGLRVQIAA